MAKTRINTRKSSSNSKFVEVEGLSELINGFYAIGEGNEVRESFNKALHEEASVVFARSQMLVPVDTGVLRSSGYVSPVRHTDNKTSFVEISYGGPASAYAMIVHEGFARHAEPTQRKYLEQPLNERTPVINENIARRLKDILQRKIRG
jgi:hypothetical protein